MIVSEYLRDGTLIKRYSNAGYMIERDGVRYSEAIDPADADRVYIETDELIDENSGPIDEYSEAGKILLGVAE